MTVKSCFVTLETAHGYNSLQLWKVGSVMVENPSPLRLFPVKRATLLRRAANLSTDKDNNLLVL